LKFEAFWELKVSLGDNGKEPNVTPN
jgi:hypothetical protein